MAISDKVLSEIQVKLAKLYGSEILILNGSDLTFIAATGFVTGSDGLNGSAWTDYRTALEIADGTEFDPKEYLQIITKLGIRGEKALEASLQERKVRSLKDATGAAAEAKKDQYVKLFRGRALFTAPADLKGVDVSLSGSALFIDYDDLSDAVEAELDSKMIEETNISKIMMPSGSVATLGDLTYIQVKEGREVARRSMQAQGFKISRKNLRAKPNARGTRGTFNVYNNHQEQFYATGSWKTGTGGPRIQGHAGGAESCAFVIIHRSGSRG